MYLCNKQVFPTAVSPIITTLRVFFFFPESLIFSNVSLFSTPTAVGPLQFQRRSHGPSIVFEWRWLVLFPPHAECVGFLIWIPTTGCNRRISTCWSINFATIWRQRSNVWRRSMPNERSGHQSAEKVRLGWNLTIETTVCTRRLDWRRGRRCRCGCCSSCASCCVVFRPSMCSNKPCPWYECGWTLIFDRVGWGGTKTWCVNSSWVFWVTGFGCEM